VNEFSTYVGLDVHQQTIVAAMLIPATGEVKEAAAERTARGRRKLERWLGRESEGQVLCCYEAGCAGFQVQRELAAAGYACQVIAPGLVWQQPAEQRKTDRRDARKLATQLAAGMLTEVHPPSAEEEADRGLVRARDDAQQVLHQARQRVLKFLDQRGLVYQGKHWSQKHQRWLKELQLAPTMAQVVWEEYLLALDQAEQRLARLDRLVAQLADSARYREPVGLLRCLRGIDTLAAMALLTELFEFWRFATPRALMGYLGSVPGERSSGEHQQTTGLTKAGNSVARRLVVLAAWQYMRAPRRLTQQQRRKQEGQPAEAVALAQRANERLRRRYWHLIHAGKGSCTANAAVARELIGFIWAILQPWAQRELAKQRAAA